MPQRTTIQQAACDALAEWLTSEIASEDVSVDAEWVEPDRQLTPKQITIIEAGPRDIDWLDPEAVVTTNVNVGSKKSTDAIWLLGQVTQPVQLDVWAQTKAELDDLMARLDDSLNKGSNGIDVACEPRPGILLRLPCEWSPGIVDFLFESPSILQAPDSVGEGEWRAMYRGRASAQLTQKARSARIARGLLNARLYDRGADAGMTPETTVLTLND